VRAWPSVRSGGAFFARNCREVDNFHGPA